MFDKVMESVALMSGPQNVMKHLIKKEFKIASACLFMCAKFEDPKYPFLFNYLELLLSLTETHEEFHSQILTFFEIKGSTIGKELVDLELFIL